MNRFQTRHVAGVIALASALLLGGCVPSDPPAPPVGARLDGDVLTLLVRICPGDHIVSATVTEMLTDSLPPPAWHATDFDAPDETSAVAVPFNATSWKRTSGDYANLNEYSPEVETDQRSYGTVVGGEFGIDAQDLTDLAPGTYDVDGQNLTAPAYVALTDKQKPCPTPSR